MRQRINFCGPTFEARDGRINDQVAVNMYPRPTGPQARAPVVLYSLIRKTIVKPIHSCVTIRRVSVWTRILLQQHFCMSELHMRCHPVGDRLSNTSGSVLRLEL